MTPTLKPLVIRYREWDCELEFKKYHQGGALAIQLFDANDGEPVTTASVNPDFSKPWPPPYIFRVSADPLFAEAYSACQASPNSVPKGYVAIKTWGMENEGVLGALVEGKIVADTGIRIRCGYAEAALCKLLVDISA
jgi:hypothetical protein